MSLGNLSESEWNGTTSRIQLANISHHKQLAIFPATAGTPERTEFSMGVFIAFELNFSFFLKLRLCQFILQRLHSLDVICNEPVDFLPVSTISMIN